MLGLSLAVLLLLRDRWLGDRGLGARGMGRRERDRGLDVDLEVPGRVRAALTGDPGQVVALIGPNGAGKSSLVHALAGLVLAERPGAPRRGRPAAAVRPRARGRPGLPGPRPLPAPHGPRQRRLRARGPAGSSRREARRPRRPVAGADGARPTSATAGPASSPAARRSAWPSPAPWPPSPGCCCSTSRWPASTSTVAMALRVELARHLRDYDGVTLLVTHDAHRRADPGRPRGGARRGPGRPAGQPRRTWPPTPAPRTSHAWSGSTCCATATASRRSGPATSRSACDRPEGSARLAWSGPGGERPAARRRRTPAASGPSPRCWRT